MSDRVLVPLADGRWLALDIDVFREALAAGSELGMSRPATALHTSPPAPDSTEDEPLVDSDVLAKEFNIPPSWIEQAGRDGRLPCVQFGRWRRFKASEVKACISAWRDIGKGPIKGCRPHRGQPVS